MRVLLLSHAHNNPNAGASSVYHMLRQGLAARGHQADLLHLDEMGLPAHPLAGKMAMRFFLPRQIARRAEKLDLSGYDVIMASNGTAWPLFRKLQAWPLRPLRVSHFHGLSLYDRIASLSEAELGHHRLSPIFRYMTGSIPGRWDMAGAAHSDLSIVQNLRDQAYLESRLPGAARIACIHPAIAPDLIAAAGSIAALETRSVRKLITFASWGARKGSFYLPGALRRIRRHFPQVELVLGGTNMSVEQLRPYFDPADHGAIQVPGFLSRPAQARLYNEAGIFLFPSVSEGFGLALAEAQIFGLAAVTTHTGYAGDFLTDGVDARVVALSSEHLANAVRSLLENDPARRTMAMRGRQLALGFTQEAMASAYERAFEEGLEKLRQRRPESITRRD